MKSDDLEESFNTLEEVFMKLYYCIREKTMRQKKSEMKRSPNLIKVFWNQLVEK